MNTYILKLSQNTHFSKILQQLHTNLKDTLISTEGESNVHNTLHIIKKKELINVHCQFANDQNKQQNVSIYMLKRIQ